MDIRSVKPNGDKWNFRSASDRKEARRLVRKLNPDWLVGAPPCTAFSIWNFGINYKKMSEADVKAKLEEGRIHLDFVAGLYRDQIGGANTLYMSSQRQHSVGVKIPSLVSLTHFHLCIL